MFIDGVQLVDLSAFVSSLCSIDTLLPTCCRHHYIYESFVLPVKD